MNVKSGKIIIIVIMFVIGFLCLNINESISWPRYRVYTTPKVYVVKPGPNYVWVDGHWKVNKYGKTVWVPGHWKKV